MLKERNDTDIHVMKTRKQWFLVLFEVGVFLAWKDFHVVKELVNS